MMSTRERVDFAELVLLDLQARADKAEKVKSRAIVAYFSDLKKSKASRKSKAAMEAAITTEYDLFNQCLELEAELVELQRVLATGTDPHPALSEGAL